MLHVLQGARLLVNGASGEWHLNPGEFRAQPNEARARYHGTTLGGWFARAVAALRRAEQNRRVIPIRLDDEPDFDRQRSLFLTFNNSKFTGGKMMIAPNAEYQVSFAGAPAGVYDYTCTPHTPLGMNATLTVEN